MLFREIKASNAWPLLGYVAVTIGLVGVTLGPSYVLGERHRSKIAEELFESGVVSVGDASARFAANFYLVAMIFDLEAIFISAWDISFRQVGWTGYTEVLIFIGILLAALVYQWRVGALDWAPRSLARVA